MLELPQDSNRQVIPRWRSFVHSLEFGELKPLNNQESNIFPFTSLSDSIDDWHHTQSLSVACDVLSTAFTIGHAHSLNEIAEFIISKPESSPHARSLAIKCREGNQNLTSEEFIRQYDCDSFEQLNSFIHNARHRLQQLPHNPVLWTNLALAHTTLGNTAKAEQAIITALGLAPDNRFVVRAGCRFFLHSGDIDRAISILRRTNNLRHDPWILASEIATSDVRRKSSSLIQHARRMVDKRNFSKFHLSELTSTLATLEAGAGRTKKARNFCEFSLLEPSENSIAQAAWLSRNTYIRLPSISSDIDKSYEAKTWTATKNEDWDLAVKNAISWQDEQPFSSRPAMHGGMIANAMLDDYVLAENILRKAEYSNRGDAQLGNNLAFALAKQNKIEEAIQAINRINPSTLNGRLEVCIKATEGLIKFRSGDHESGRDLYRNAINTADNYHFADLIAIAKSYLAIEEMQCNSPTHTNAFQEAMTEIESLPEPFKSLHKKRLDSTYQKLRCQTEST
jgi:tetratricopeptide (TPR) repeat protein